MKVKRNATECRKLWEWLNKDEQEDLYIAFGDKVKPLWEWTIFYPKERFLDRFIQFLLDNVEEWGIERRRKK